MAKSKSFWSWDAMLLALLVVSLFVGRAFSQDFLGTDNVGNLLASVVEIGLMALGLTLVVVAAEIDLSIAAILGMASGLLGVLFKAGVPMPMAIALVLLMGAAAGAFNGLLVTKLRLPSLAVTIGTMALFRGITYILLGDEAVASFPAHYTAFGFDMLGSTFLPLTYVFLLIPLALVFILILQFSGIGRLIYAMGANETAVRFSGVDAARIKVWLFVVSGLMSALAGIVYTLRFSSARADNGTGFELNVVAAVLFGGVSIFGGRGTLVGVLLAVLIMGVFNNALTLFDVSNEILTIVTGLLLLSSVLVPNLAERWRVRKLRRAVMATVKAM
ncbi:ABC transporter permease [Rhodoferax sp.]|uniref:ABC transporter permease n=1 Tax=Rhodoferax sp. TaxID=50421 RepID=UPI00374CA088